MKMKITSQKNVNLFMKNTFVCTALDVDLYTKIDILKKFKVNLFTNVH